MNMQIHRAGPAIERAYLCNFTPVAQPSACAAVPDSTVSRIVLFAISFVGQVLARPA